MSENVVERSKQDFVINTQINVKDADHIEYLTHTDIAEIRPDLLNDPRVYDPNTVLFFYWTQALAACVGLKDVESREALGSDLFEIIFDVENESVACQVIAEKYNLPSIAELAAEGKEDDADLPLAGTRFINVEIHHSEEKKGVTMNIKTDVPDYSSDGRNKLLFYYWTRAIADCAIALESDKERKYLADKLYEKIMETDETLLASINDSE